LVGARWLGVLLPAACLAPAGQIDNSAL
jgi:hypothetical protein